MCIIDCKMHAAVLLHTKWAGVLNLQKHLDLAMLTTTSHIFDIFLLVSSSIHPSSGLHCSLHMVLFFSIMACRCDSTCSLHSWQVNINRVKGIQCAYFTTTLFVHPCVLFWLWKPPLIRWTCQLFGWTSWRRIQHKKQGRRRGLQHINGKLWYRAWDLTSKSQ